MLSRTSADRKRPVQVLASATRSGRGKTNRSNTEVRARERLYRTDFTTARRGFWVMCWSLGRRTGYQPMTHRKRKAASLSGHMIRLRMETVR